jgi:di/tricarboxylate transporter
MIPVTVPQAIVFGTLLFVLALLVYGRVRYDIVALLALFIVTLTGVVGWDQAFLGFAHPAVITVAAVLVISRGLQNAGLVDLIARRLSRFGDGPALQVSALTGLVTALSAVMNNVGAVALLMPVGTGMAQRSGRSPAPLLLTMAFGSLLGGLITLIGTPPNIIIAYYRAEHAAGPFTMFDFSPVGLGVALAGVLFIVSVGWRLVPRRAGRIPPKDLFELGDYLAEVRVPANSPFEGRSLAVLADAMNDGATVSLLERGGSGRSPSDPRLTIAIGDILVVRGDARALQSFVDQTGFTLEIGEGRTGRPAVPGETALVEAAVREDSPVVGRTVTEAGISADLGVDLIAVARRGTQPNERLGVLRIGAGDVLLLRGTPDALQEAVRSLGSLPLVERGLRIGEPRRVVLAVGVFGLAIAGAALGQVPVEGAFAMAAVAMVLLSLVRLSEVYRSIDWPVIVLLGALIPVGAALESTGGARLIADSLLGLEGHLPVAALLVTVMVVTMLISNIINNAATAVLMAPIAVSLAGGLGVSADPFLMAVAVGASTPFLTPIGHQSNALVMGASGLRFGDYWRLGLPLSAVVLTVAVPLILLFWPP